MGAAGRHVRWIGLRAEQEFRCSEKESQRILDSGFERPVLAAGLVKAQQQIDVGLTRGLAISAAGERRENLPGACGFVDRVSGTANEYSPPAWRIAGTDRSVRPCDIHVLDERDAVHVLEIVIACMHLERFVVFGGVLAN